MSERDAMFLRPAEAATLAGLSTRAIYRAIERGELRAAVLAAADPARGVRRVGRAQRRSRC
jgi:hypothetical protein